MIRRLRDLSLFWKLLLPFVVLLLVTGTGGGFLVVNNLATQARTRLEADLSQRTLELRAKVQEQELYLLESGNFAANLEGVAQATDVRDPVALTRALDSVLALKTNLEYSAIVSNDGTPVIELNRSEPNAPPAAVHDTAATSLVSQVQALPDGGTAVGFAQILGRPALTMATSICSGPPGCAPLGVAVVAVDARQLLPAQLDTAVFDGAGHEIITQGLAPAALQPPQVNPDRLVRREGNDHGTATATAYAPLVLQGRQQGTIAVTLPTKPAFASVRSAALRLALVLFAVMVGIVIIGALLSRSILGQVRSVRDTAHALGSGDLDARAPVRSNDEIGALATGVNTMADQLRASYDTLEQRVAERTTEVQDLLHERSEFFAAMSHELRTPVAVFLAHADLLDDPTFPKKAAWQTQSAATLRAAGEQILDFVEAILALAKAETGGLNLDIERAPLAEVVRELQPTLDGLAAAAGVRLAIRLPARLPLVRADRARLRDVLMNLVDNAVKYTPSGGKVDVTAAANGNGIHISVIDTGVGIPADEIKQVFEPFYRVRSTVTQAGQPSSGLGLALVKRLVDAHGGTIDVVSSPAKGSTFTVTLPTVTSTTGDPLAG